MALSPITLLAAAAVVLGAAASTQAAVAVPPPSATLGVCHQAPALADRYATFAAQMSAVPTTTQMSIRLELDERTPGDADYHALTGVPGFGIWKSSAIGVGIFGYSQEVTSLVAPASFRVSVSYRWIGAHRRVIKRAKRTTPTCTLAAPAASLVVGSLSNRPPAASALPSGACTSPPAAVGSSPPEPAQCR